MAENINYTCAFCAEQNKIDNSYNFFYQFLAAHTNCMSRIVMETENFVVMPTAGCFVEGYLLIVSKEHYYSAASMYPELLDELTTLIDNVRTQLQKAYGMQVICFEHGSSSCANSMGGCIDHAHIHLIPYDSSLTEEILPYGLHSKRIHSLKELQNYGIDNLPYLYWQDIDGAMYVVDEGFVPSQFLRRIAANHYNKPGEWDWRQYPYMDNMIKTIVKLCPQMEVV